MAFIFPLDHGSNKVVNIYCSLYDNICTGFNAASPLAVSTSSITLCELIYECSMTLLGNLQPQLKGWPLTCNQRYFVAWLGRNI